MSPLHTHRPAWDWTESDARERKRAHDDRAAAELLIACVVAGVLMALAEWMWPL